METQDIRWQQRFQNFSKSMQFLKQALEIPNPDIVQKAGIIQFFEMSFELAWNLLKDYLESQGFEDVKSPRAALKKAFETNLIEAGHNWMELLQDRNLTSHTYDEQKASDMEQLIQHKYYPLLNALLHSFGSKINEK